ncbi:hypothetical protein FG386_003710 [Cryptosporidium ryanae]|uniref:uncharacterized protein n=1 Tax=Cryptosporidium ryanae TaxID=515981 RepID=UPI00351A561E|nr:hypothetical protein FG386_003710 [Cryptosporidium ryanae]
MKGFLPFFLSALFGSYLISFYTFLSVGPHSLLRVRSDDNGSSGLGSETDPPPPPPLPTVSETANRPSVKQQLILNISTAKWSKFLDFLKNLGDDYEDCKSLIDWLVRFSEEVILCLKSCLQSTESCEKCLNKIKKGLTDKINEEMGKSTKSICIELLEMALKFTESVMEYKVPQISILSVSTSTSTSTPGPS